MTNAGNIVLRTFRPGYMVYLGGKVVPKQIEKWNVFTQYDPQLLSQLEYIDLRFKDQIVIKRKT